MPDCGFAAAVPGVGAVAGVDVFSRPAVRRIRAPEVADGEEMDLEIALGVLWKGRYRILACALLLVAVFGIAAWLTRPAYRASAVLVPATGDSDGASALLPALGRLGGLASLAGVSLGSQGVEESLAVLRSRQFTETLIKDLDLLPGLFPGRWDEDAGRWTNSKAGAPSLAQGFRRFDRRVRVVTFDKKTNLVKISAVWHDPEGAADLVNEMISRINREMRDRAIARTNASVQFLQKELEGTQAVETRQVISRLMESQINQRMYANVTGDYALRVVDPALPPDPDDRVRPRTLLMLLLGGVVGTVVGGLLILAMHALRGRREPS